MRSRAFVVLPLCLLLSGCGDMLLERSYSSLAPHSDIYWENEDADVLRAENYQDLVNTLLLLLEEHSEDGVVRIYGEYSDAGGMSDRACVEVQQETALGSYLLDYITYSGTAEGSYYELTVHFGYRRTAEEQSAIVNATSTEALPDLLRSAIEEKKPALAVRVGYFGTDRAGVMELVRGVHDEVYPPEEEAEDAEEEEAAPPENAEGAAEVPLAEEAEITLPDVSPWEVFFYPDNDQPSLLEVVLHQED